MPRSTEATSLVPVPTSTPPSSTATSRIRQTSPKRCGASVRRLTFLGEFPDPVAMANYRANRLACEAADRAMQTCGGIGYTRHMPVEHIYRHHRRYRITEGSEEIQLRKVAQELFSAP